ncbi:lysin A [Microbacterium phage Triscuit]|nr:lysin A [Microbacterium phage Triscuit]
MGALKNHPGMWLNDVAAAAYNAYEAKYGVKVINSAGRFEWEQQNLINRWDIGGKANRPPYLYEPARPARTSAHVRNGGEAVDMRDYNTVKAGLAEFGFKWYGSGDPVHFTHNGDRRWLDAANGTPSGAFSQIVQNEQNFLISRGFDLGPSGADGRYGPATKAAYQAYQRYLAGRGWYKGDIDGVWGPATQAAHAIFYNEINPPTPAPSTPSSGVPGGLPWNGIQEMLRRHYGYTGKIDNNPGGGTVTAFQKFLNAQNYNAGKVDGQWGKNTGMAAQRWLKARWGYTGAIDNDYGSGTRNAWARANAANAAAF